MKKNTSKILFALYFGLLVGIAWADVGEAYGPGVHKWYTPILIAILLINAYWLGYDSARE